MKIEITNEKIKLGRKIKCLSFICMTEFYKWCLKTKFKQAGFTAKCTVGKDNNVQGIYLNGHKISPKDEVAMYYLSLYLIIIEKGYNKVQAANFILNLD